MNYNVVNGNIKYGNKFALKDGKITKSFRKKVVDGDITILPTMKEFKFIYIVRQNGSTRKIRYIRKTVISELNTRTKTLF